MGKLPIHLSENDINGADASDGVGDQLAPDHIGKRLKIDEGGPAEVNAQRFGRAVAGDETAEFAAWRFDGDKDLAGRGRKALGENLEMVDESFHFGLHFFALRGDDAGRVRLNGSLVGNLSERLADDFYALAHFRDADEITRVTIGFGARGHVEVEFLVGGVGEKLAVVVGDARGAQAGAGGAEGDELVGGKNADAFEAALPDAVFGEESFVLVDVRGHGVDEAFDHFAPTGWRIERQAADADVAGHHALAGEALENFQDFFALAEAIEQDRHGAHVEGVGAQPNQVRRDAL